MLVVRGASSPEAARHALHAPMFAHAHAEAETTQSAKDSATGGTPSDKRGRQTKRENASNNPRLDGYIAFLQTACLSMLCS